MVPQGNPHSSDVGPVPEESCAWKKKANSRKSSHRQRVLSRCQMVSGFVPVRPATLQSLFFWEKKTCRWRERWLGGYWLSWETELRHTNGNSSLLVWPIITRGLMWLGHNAEPHSASDMKRRFPFKCFKEMRYSTVLGLGGRCSHSGLAETTTSKEKKQLENVANPPEKKLLMSPVVTSELPSLSNTM